VITTDCEASTNRYKHALTLHDRSTAAEEANDEDHDTGHDAQNRRSEEAHVGYDRRVASLGHLQPDANTEHRATQQLVPKTHPTCHYTV